MAIRIKNIQEMLVLLYIFIGFLTAQEQIIKHYGGFQVVTVPYDAVWTNDGKIAVTGITENDNSNWNSFIALFDSTYDCLWAKILHLNPWDISYKINQTDDGGYAVSGYTGPILGPVDFCLYKFDNFGNLRFAKSIGGSNNDVGFCFLKETDSDFLLSGHTNGFGAADYNIMLVRIDSIGNLEWARVIDFSGASGSHNSHETVIQFGGGYVVVCQATENMVIAQFDSLWNTVWAKEVSYLPSHHLLPSTVITTNDSGLVVLGDLTLPPSHVNDDIYLMKMDSVGNIEWTKRLGLEEENHNAAVALRSKTVVKIESGEYIINAHAYYSSGGIVISTPTIWKIGPQGNLIWMNTAEYKTGEGSRHPLLQTSDYGYLYWGTGSPPWSDSGLVTLIKFDSSGHTCMSDTFTYTVIDSSIYPSIAQIAPVINTINPTVVNLTPTIYDCSIYDSSVCEYQTAIKDFYDNFLGENSIIVNTSLFFNDRLEIRFFRSSPNPLRITIYNVLGRRVYENALRFTPNRVIIEGNRVGNLPAGVYFLLVDTSLRNIYRTKLIKIKD